MSHIPAPKIFKSIHLNSQLNSQLLTFRMRKIVHIKSTKDIYSIHWWLAGSVSLHYKKEPKTRRENKREQHPV